MFNEQLINEVAGFAFWTKVQQNGRMKTVESLERRGETSFLGDAEVMSILEMIGVALDPNDLPDFKSAVVDEIKEHHEANRNIIGPIYFDEITRSRSSSALDVQTRHLSRPMQLSLSGMWSKTGTLILRTPLPSALLCSRPVSGVVEVEDTTEALGFHYPLMMAVDACAPIAPDVYIAMGVFYTPVESVKHGDQWACVVPNTINFLEQCTVGHASMNVVSKQSAASKLRKWLWQ